MSRIGKTPVKIPKGVTVSAKGQTLSVGGTDVAIPLTQFGSVSDTTGANLNVTESYTVDVVRGDRRGGQRASVTNANGGATSFAKPSASTRYSCRALASVGGRSGSSISDSTCLKALSASDH